VWPWHQIALYNDDNKIDVDELVTAVSRLSTVSQGSEDTPAVLSFGHRRGRGMSFGQKSGRGRGRGRGAHGRGNTSEPPSPGAAAAQL
jgi:hypothetical protein